MSLLFISQAIYEHGEPWWNDTNRGKFLIRTAELSGNPTSRPIVSVRFESTNFGSKCKHVNHYTIKVAFHTLIKEIRITGD
jgi:hypothetical protein